MNRLTLLTLLLLPSTLFAQREFGFDNRKGSGQEYLTPAETVKRFQVAPEFEVKLFAGEPLMTNPIAFTIDEKGRTWIVESFEYPKRTPKGKAPRDRIVILEDTDGDGMADKRTVFAEGKDFPVTEERKKAGLGAFDMASGIEVGNGGVYVGAPPYLYFIENKDDKPGKFEVLLKGFGSEDTHETLNTFQWGPDGWLYGLHGVFTFSTVKSLDGEETRMNAAVWRLNPRTKKFEIFSEGTSNPWGLDWRNTDGQFILACCVIPHLYHMVPGGIYQRQAGASYNPYVYNYIKEISDHTFHRESGWAHAGLISLDVPHMPEKYRNSVIFGSIHGCSLKQNILRPNGSSYIASRGDDFLKSGDKNFRPINLKWGPLGDIYLIDWHDQNPCHQTKPDDWDYERGRVYRIQLKGTQPKKAEDLGKLSREQLLTQISTGTPYYQRTALRLAAELPVEKLAPSPTAKELVEIRKLSTVKDPRPLWAANATNPVDEENVASFTSDNPWVKAAITNHLLWSIRPLGESKYATAALVNEFSKLSASEPSVRRELASAAIRLADKHDVTPLLRSLMSRTEDANDPLIPNLVWIAYEKVLTSRLRKQSVEPKPKAAAPTPAGVGSEKPGVGSEKPGVGSPSLAEELAWLAEQSPKNIFVRDQIVPKVMRRLVATGQPEDLALCLKFVKDVKDLYSREKALDGLVIALANQTVDAPAVWTKLQSELRQEAKLVGLVNKLSVNFRDPLAFRRANEVLVSRDRSVAEKVEAVRSIAQLQGKGAADTLVQMARQEQPEPIRVEAIRGLSLFKEASLARQMLQYWSAYSPAIRAEAVTVLSSRKDWAAELLKAMEQKQIDRKLVSDNIITRIQAFGDKNLNAMIEKSWGRTRPTPKELDTLIVKMRGELQSGSGDFAKGKKVFEAQCAKCHKFDGKGQEVGPALDGAGRDIEYILANVIDPNRVIGAPYFQRIVQTIDGRLEQGLLAEEDDLSITLKVENGVRKRFPKKDLDGPVRVLEKSMMPEGLTYGMTPQDFRDLVTYLMAHPFVNRVTVNGQAVRVPVTGNIPLPKSDQDVKVETTVTAREAMTTQLLLGGTGRVQVLLDGKELFAGSLPKAVAPDQLRVDVTLPKGESKLTIISRGGAQVLIARLLDPERRLTGE